MIDWLSLCSCPYFYFSANIFSKRPLFNYTLKIGLFLGHPR